VEKHLRMQPLGRTRRRKFCDITVNGIDYKSGTARKWLRFMSSSGTSVVVVLEIHVILPQNILLLLLLLSLLLLYKVCILTNGFNKIVTNLRLA
jgi:MinD-like ATPase involved in chromosome partitioning or flagellar assembly